MNDLMDRARVNLERLRRNPYPGRGIVIGVPRGGSSHIVQIYWIMGRSENSRNRVFSNDGGRVFTEAADPSKVTDPSLIIYNAMDEADGNFIVSNGSQTDTLMIDLAAEDPPNFYTTMGRLQYEPDKPNFTPRITALCSLRGMRPFMQMGIVRKCDWNMNCTRHVHRLPSPPPGIGFCITTYQGDGNPLPAFEGEPYPVLLEDDYLASMTRRYWDLLNPENRVALVVKFINRNTGKSSVEIVNSRIKV